MKFRDSYKTKNFNFERMNRAFFEDLRLDSNNKNKFLLMTEQELVDCGFYKRYPHLKEAP